jgi:hypothetical protein
MSLGAPYWCDQCQDHFDREHYAGDGLDGHLVGAGYGPTGARLARSESREAALRQLVDAVAPLVVGSDDDGVIPFNGAWEFENGGGQKAHAQLAAAYERAVAALRPAIVPTDEDANGTMVTWRKGQRVVHVGRGEEYTVLADGVEDGTVLCDVDGEPVWLNAHNLEPAGEASG